MGVAEIINRMLSAIGGKTQGDLGRALGISQASISDAKRKEKIPPEWVVKLSTEHNLNPSWLLTGHGQMLIESAKDSPQPDEKASAGGGIDPHRASQIAFKVTSSKTPYARALWENLVSLEKAVDREEEMGRLEEMMKKIMEDNKEMKEKLDRLERASRGAEKRDPAANA